MRRQEVPREVFREYDIRGLAGSQLTPALARLVARAFAGWMDERVRPAGDERRVIVARDNRRSSPELAAGLIQGFREAGWPVLDAGVAPTPVLYFARQAYAAIAGVMVTGSHLPADRNGFKLAYGHGTLHGDDIREIGRRVEGLALSGEATPVPAGPWTAEAVDPLPGYMAEVTGRITLGRRARPLRVAVDCGSGAASLVAPALFRALGCEVFPVWCDPDPEFPGHWPDPVKEENLHDLRGLVRDKRADLGVAFDGDGDRLGVIDDQGEILWGDVLMILFWREILSRHPGAEALVEVKCSQALVDEIHRLGGRPVFYRTGHSLIKARMREIGALFSGEMSGHMFFADEYYGFDDAFYAAARLLRILDASERPLSALLADRPRYYATPEVRLDCPDDTKFGVVDAVRGHFVGRGLEVIEVDGARVIFPRGWALVRASNTQPAVVVRCEARTPEDLEELKRVTRAALSELTGESGLSLPDW